MLDAIKHTSKYKIMKDDLYIYNAEKHRLPCWNCIVRSTCFSEKKATKRAKNLRYTVKFEKSCIESILAMDLIYMAYSNLLISSLSEFDDMTISELSDVAFDLFIATEGDLADGREYGPEAYALFISLTQRDSNRFEDEFAYVYYQLGRIFRFYFEEIDHAINLYSKAIDFKPDISDFFEYRGECFFKKNDYKNALNDFKKALEIDGETFYYLKDTIEECEMALGIR